MSEEAQLRIMRNYLDAQAADSGVDRANTSPRDSEKASGRDSAAPELLSVLRTEPAFSFFQGCLWDGVHHLETAEKRMGAGPSPWVWAHEAQAFVVHSWLSRAWTPHYLDLGSSISPEAQLQLVGKCCQAGEMHAARKVAAQLLLQAAWCEDAWIMCVPPAVSATARL